MPEISDPSTLFTQLQARYPTSSLITELVPTHETGFVVRAIVQISGAPLATSMAAAPTIEQAEDLARIRVCKLLGIATLPIAAAPGLSTTGYNFPPSLLNQPLENGSSLAAVSSPEIGKPAAIGTPPSLPEPLPPLPRPAPEEEFQLPAASRSKSRATTVPSLDDAIAPAEKFAAPRSKARAAAVPNLDDAIEAVPFEFETIAPSGATTPATAIEPASLVPPAVDEPPEAELPPSPEPTDLSELIALTDIEMQRVGWTRKRGQTHLKQTYSKDKRADLDEEQLLEFLHFLRALPSRYETPVKE
jgi:hypothetical protein